MGSGHRSWAATVYIAALTFAILIMVFGVLPSEFIGWFNKRFNDINLRRFVRDPIVVVWHLMAIGAFVIYAVKYQGRQERQAKKKAEAAATGSEPESAYGRPLRSGA